MTIIVVRDGIMAVDGLVGAGGVMFGNAKKWREVAPEHGGGFIAGAGTLATVARFIDRCEATGDGQECGEQDLMIHLRADGSVKTYEHGAWYEFEAPYFCAGSGEQVALGALAHGATAEEAVRIACDLTEGCGGEISVLKI